MGAYAMRWSEMLDRVDAGGVALRCFVLPHGLATLLVWLTRLFIAFYGFSTIVVSSYCPCGIIIVSSFPQPRRETSYLAMFGRVY